MQAPPPVPAPFKRPPMPLPRNLQPIPAPPSSAQPIPAPPLPAPFASEQEPPPTADVATDDNFGYNQNEDLYGYTIKENPIFQKKTPYTANADKYSQLSTYLGYLLQDNNTQNNDTSYKKLTPMQVVGRYEAVLTQALYMSRLAYEPDNIKMAAVQFINHTPVVFNTAVRIFNANKDFLDPEKNGLGARLLDSTKQFFTTNFITDIVGKNLLNNAYPPINIQEGSIRNGVIIQNSGRSTHCYMQLIDNTWDIQETNRQPTPLPGKKVLYISFRGSFQFLNFLSVLAAKLWSLSNLFSKCSIDDKTVIDALFIGYSPEEKAAEMPHIKAHGGLIWGLQILLQEVLNQVKVFSEANNDTIDQIIITGHSMGGAQACITAMMLAAFKELGIPCLQKPTLHCITFGAPKFFSPTARNKFNSYLLKGFLTFDRIANRPANLGLGAANLFPFWVDTIPFLFPNMQHPGYSILKNENLFFGLLNKAKGRFKNISDIRKNIGGNDPNSFNELPRYREFLQNFIMGKEGDKNVFTLEEYSDNKTLRISNVLFGTIYKAFTLPNSRLLEIYTEIREMARFILGPVIPAGQELRDSVPPNEVDLKKEVSNATNMPPEIPVGDDGNPVDLNQQPEVPDPVGNKDDDDGSPPPTKLILPPPQTENDLFDANGNALPNGVAVEFNENNQPPSQPGPPSPQGPPGPQGPPVQPYAQSQAGGGFFQNMKNGLKTSINSSNAYKDETMKNGPNHVVYACKKKVSPIWGHAGYMGVSFTGCLRNLLRAAANTDTFKQIVVADKKITLVESMKEQFELKKKEALDKRNEAGELRNKNRIAKGFKPLFTPKTMDQSYGTGNKLINLGATTGKRVLQFFGPGTNNTGAKIGEKTAAVMPGTATTQGGRYTKKGWRKYNRLFTKRKPKQQRQPKRQKKVKGTGKSRRYVKLKRRFTAKRQQLL